MRRLYAHRWLLLSLLAASTPSCYRLRLPDGGGETTAHGGGPVESSNVAVLQGFEIQPVARGLEYPTGVTFDEAGHVFVVEAGYAYGEDFTTPRLIEVHADGSVREIVRGKNGPWTGVVYHEQAFYVAEGGETDGGRILRITRDGKIKALVEKLPSLGDHHTDGPVIGRDGYLYFGQGTFTNSGVVGVDNYKLGWGKRHPQGHDIPCRDITLAGVNLESDDPFTTNPKDKASTGAFSPFGTVTERGQVVRGAVPCSGAIMRVPLAGGAPELVAWGFRNPFGLAFSPDGRLFATDNGFDTRGSRPIWGGADVLWEVKSGVWYGWPDYSAGLPVDDERFKSPGQAAPSMLLAIPPGTPPAPAVRFAAHSSSDGFDFSRNPVFGYVGQAFVAQFGDQTPATGKVLFPVGFRVVRVDVDNGVIADFVSNKGDKNGPRSKLQSGGMERPVAVRFDPPGTALYIVDFGQLSMSTDGDALPVPGTGVLWRLRRTGARP